jgi:hypothetical protein
MRLEEGPVRLPAEQLNKIGFQNERPLSGEMTGFQQMVSIESITEHPAEHTEK